MAVVAAYGIQVTLPPRFEARIYRRSPGGGAAGHPIAHFGTFPLPQAIPDFGGGVTQNMGPDDVFAVLFEYGPESLGTALFAARGIPAFLGIDDFYPFLLRRPAGGQSGTQWFFTEQGRPFTFYAVLGSHVRRPVLVPEVNQLLQQISISPRPAGGG